MSVELFFSIELNDFSFEKKKERRRMTDDITFRQFYNIILIIFFTGYEYTHSFDPLVYKAK